MQSELIPGFVYRDTGRDITESDLDVISDLWNMDGREVYRGSRDPRYTHANVYWLYSESLERVGLCEHDLSDHAEFRILWFRETEFGTYLQEDGWEQSDDVWSHIPRHAFDRCINEGWTTPSTFLEQCLHGPVRLFTVEMIDSPPKVYGCSKCGKKSLYPIPTCSTSESYLDFPDTQKVFFVDSDMILYTPPPSSRVWDILTRRPSRAGDSQPVLEQETAARSPPPDAQPEPHQETPPAEAEPCSEQHSPPRSHP